MDGVNGAGQCSITDGLGRLECTDCMILEVTTTWNKGGEAGRLRLCPKSGHGFGCFVNWRWQLEALRNGWGGGEGMEALFCSLYFFLLGGWVVFVCLYVTCIRVCVIGRELRIKEKSK